MTASDPAGRVLFPGTNMRLDPEMYRLVIAKWDPKASTVVDQTPVKARAAVVIGEPTEPIGETRDLQAPEIGAFVRDFT